MTDDRSLTSDPQLLVNHQAIASLLKSYHYYFDSCSSELTLPVSLRFIYSAESVLRLLAVFRPRVSPLSFNPPNIITRLLYLLVLYAVKYFVHNNKNWS